jgi:hypothetical protein
MVLLIEALTNPTAYALAEVDHSAQSLQHPGTLISKVVGGLGIIPGGPNQVEPNETRPQ